MSFFVCLFVLFCFLSFKHICFLHQFRPRRLSVAAADAAAVAAAVDSSGIAAAGRAAAVQNDGEWDTLAEGIRKCLAAAAGAASAGAVTAADVVDVADAVTGSACGKTSNLDDADVFRAGLEHCCKCVRGRDQWTCSCAPASNTTDIPNKLTQHPPDIRKSSLVAGSRCSVAGHPDEFRCIRSPSTVPRSWISPRPEADEA